MSRLPEEGDVAVATDLWNARIEATTGGDQMCAGPVRITEHGAVGEGMSPILRAAGDLFDPGAGVEMIRAAIVDMLRDGDVQSALATVVLQSTALGVLMERARWERRP